MADPSTVEGTKLIATIAAAGFAKRGIYENFAEENFRKFRAAVARQRAGKAACRISVLGDSNSNGFMAPSGADYRRSYGERARSILEGDWGPSRTGFIFSRIGHSGGTYAIPDQRSTLGSGWSALADANYGPAGAGAIQGVGPTAGRYELNSGEKVDTFDIYLKQSSDSPTAVTTYVDGVAAGSVLAADSFSGSVALGGTTTEVGGLTWVTSSAGIGSWTRDAGRAKAVKVAGTGPLQAVVNTGQADGKVSVRRSSDIQEGLAFRWSDVNNYLLLAMNGSSQYIIAKVVSTAVTVLATSAVVASPNDLLAVVLNGSSIGVEINGVAVPALSVTETFNQAATNHGMRIGGTTAITTYMSEFRHVAPGGATIGLTGSDAVRKVTVSAPSVGSHTIGISVVSSGTAVVLAVEAYDATANGLRWTLAGHSGGKAEDWNASHPAAWGSQNLVFNLSKPDLSVINLMINAHDAAQPIATYKAEMKTFISAAKAVGDVVIVASPAAGDGSSATWVDYLGALREIAVEVGCGLINMQERWGAFALANAAPYLLWNDNDHPSTIGYWDMGQALADGMRLAAGRSA